MKIQKAILSGEPSEVIGAFESMDAKQRKSVAKGIREWVDRLHQDCTAGARVRGALRADLKELGFDLDHLDESYRHGFSPVARLALFATQPLGELARHTWSYDDGEACVDASWKILSDRKGTWATDLVAKLLEVNARNEGVIEGAVILTGVERGVIEQPDGSNYLQCLAAMANEDYQSAKRLRRDIASLENNRAFLERDVFRLLTIEHNLFHGHGQSLYRDLLKRAFAKKKIDRGAFLRSFLGGLLLDFRRNQLQGMVRFFDDLKLTEAESVALSADYASLLASPHSFIASMALTRLQGLVDSNLIPFSDCVAHLVSAFENPAKTNANKILTWISKQTKADDSLIPMSVETLLAGLGHPEPDVQKRALQLISGWKTRLHRDHAAMMREIAGGVSATLRTSLLELAGEIDGRDTSGTDSPAEASIGEMGKGDVDSRLVPIQTHEELIDRISSALEVTESGIEAEQILEAISRLGPVSKDLEDRAAPVRQRAVDAWAFSMVPGSRGLADAPDAKPRMWRVIAIALGMKELVQPEHHFDEDEAKDFGVSYPPKTVPIPIPPYEADGEYGEDSPGYASRSLGYAWHSRVLWQRLEPLEQRLLEGTLLPMLASPTDSRGWVEPSVLVDRMHQWCASKLEVDECDLILALMRLSHTGREAALKSLKGIDAELRAVLTIALDGKIPAGEPPNQGSVLLQVAARVRQPLITQAESTRLGIDASYADGSMPKLRWRMNQKVEKPKQSHQPMIRAEWSAPEWLKEHRVLSELHRYKHVHLHPSSAWRLEMDAWNDPSREAYFAGAIRRLVERVENGASNSAPYHAYFEALFDEHYVWSTTACGCAVLALLGKDNDVLSVATDALNDAIAGGRVSTSVMADAMVRVFIAPWPRAARFGENYARVAETGRNQQRFVADSLAILIQEWCSPTEFKRVQFQRLEKPADCVKVIELYNECVAALGTDVPDALREVVGSVKVKGKVATALKAIA
ncbi:MAG: DUF6493 family protein [Planctomycetota bacterium]